MSADPKIDFYLANRVLIEEWSTLRAPVVSALDRALMDAAASPNEVETDLPALSVVEDKARRVSLDCTSEPLPIAQIALIWEQSKLLRPPAGAEQWPILAVWMDPANSDPVRHAIREATAAARDSHGLVHTGRWWLRYGPLTPPSEPIVIEEYAGYCVQRLREAWLDLNDTVNDAVQAATP